MNLEKLTKKCQDFLQQHPNPGDERYSLETFKEIYPNIVDCLTKHNHRYYIDAEPIISDHNYDEMFSYLQKIEEYFPSLISQDSPTQALVGQLSEGFEKANHPVKMLSLQNSYKAEDLKRFDESLQRIFKKESPDQDPTYNYIIEPKFDGISIEIVYKDGKLTQAITRGDGYTGDDITNNVKQIENLPHKLKSTNLNLRLRGEIMMPKSQRKRINQERTENGEKIFANTRNAAAGTVKLFDSSEVKKRKLICYVYDILSEEEQTIKSHDTMYQNLEHMGLPIFGRYKKLKNIDQVIDICEDQQTQKYFEQQDIDFDGIVIKVNDYQQRQIIGETDHHPRRAIAYKFPAAQAATQIEKVEFQIGRTGIATPVAHLTPTKLSGVIISKASLHNMDYIQQKDIRLHDRVRVQRSGEVIPYIVGVISDRRDLENKPIQPPKTCPSCGTKIQTQEVYIYCPNHHHCPAQIIEQISHFVSKQSMNIDGLGEKFVEILIEQNIIKSIADIYTLQEKERILRSIPGFGHKRVKELLKEVEKSKNNELRRLLNGLGLPGIGKKMAKELQNNIAKEHKKLDDKTLIEALQNEEFLQNIYGIGDTIILSLQKRTKNSHNRELLTQLYKYGVSFNNFGNTQTKNGPLAGLHFTITGSFELPRPEIIEQLENFGGIFDSSPTTKTDFILIGEKAGSKKAKAEKLGLKIISSTKELEDTYKLKLELTTHKNKPQTQSLF